MPIKTTFTKKQVEQSLMLRLRMDLLLLDANVPEMFKKTLDRRLDAGKRALEERINLYGPSVWFESSFINSMSYYAGYCWSARLTGCGYKVFVCNSLEEEKVAMV